MPKFRYLAYQQTGVLNDGTVEAPSLEQALEKVWQRGLVPFETYEEADPQNQGWRLALFSQQPSRREVAVFTREFATLAQANIPLDDALRMISEQPLATRMRPILARLLEAVLNGSHLSEVMSKYPKTFSHDYVSLIRAAEASGNLAGGLTELSDLLDRRLELAGKITSALVYPIILMVVALASVAIVVCVLVPAIAPIFIESGRAMPPTIAVLLTLRQSWPLVLAFGIAAALSTLAVGIFASRANAVRAFCGRVSLELPLFGIMSREQNAASFARTLGTLLRAGMPLISAFSAACSVVRNRYIASCLRTSLDGLRDGQSLAHSLSHSPLPSAASRMIAVGEEVGRLDQMLLRTAIMLEQQYQRRIERLMTLLTPALTIGLAVFVGTLVLTIMSAILSLNELAIQ
jgi:general secretion pathway protein F